MTDKHRATDEQWLLAASEALDGSHADSCLLELRDRIKALEAFDHHPLLATVRAQSETVAHLCNSVERLQELHDAVVDLNQHFDLDPLVARVEALELALRAQAGLLTTDEQTELGVMPASDAMDAAKRAAAEASKHAYYLIRNISNSPVVVEGSFELGGKSYTYKGEAEPAPSPRPSALVDRVANAIYNVPCDSDAEARAAIRAVAAWLQENQGPNSAWRAVARDLMDETNK